MSKDPIRAILLEELETVTQALNLIASEPMRDLNDLDHWSERLVRVNHALQSLEMVIPVTEQERATLRMILEFHEGTFDGEEGDAPFDVRAHASLLAKVRSAHRG